MAQAGITEGQVQAWQQSGDPSGLTAGLTTPWTMPQQYMPGGAVPMQPVSPVIPAIGSTVVGAGLGLGGAFLLSKPKLLKFS